MSIKPAIGTLSALTSCPTKPILRTICSKRPPGGDLNAHFGLGDAAKVETVRLEWPSGIVQEFYDLAANQFLTVTEPARLQVLGPGAFPVQSWKGMAFEMQTSIDLKQWSSVATVTNLTGTLEFTDTSAANQLRRFYRAVVR